MTPPELLADNARRWQRLRYRYNPHTGEGSHEARRALHVVPEGYQGDMPPGVARSLMLPVQMWEPDGPERDPEVAELLTSIDEAGSLVQYCAARNLDLVQQLEALGAVRVRFDFEYWAATCVLISNDQQGSVAFVLRHPQRLYLRVILGMYWAGVPILIILLKARQWGGSTLTQIFFAWIQLWQRKGWNSGILAHVDQQAEHIRGMLEGVVKNHPASVATYTMRPYARISGVRQIDERDCYVCVGSVKHPDSLRSFTLHMMHLSEVGLWESTEKQNAEALAQGLIGGLASGIEDLACSMLVLESTAKGVGTYFHREWIASKKKENDRTPFFIAWYQIEKYSVKLPVPKGETPEQAALSFFQSFDSYERHLWNDRGCTLEQIHWYRRRLLKFSGRRFMMNAENPSDDVEAFQSTGHRYYTPEAVGRARATVREPLHVGELRGKDQDGPGALEDLRLVERSGGPLQVWRLPTDTYGVLVKRGADGKPLPIRSRFVLFYDPGGKTDAADYSVAKVIDRAPMLWGAPPEVVAVWRGHMRQDLASWAAAQLGTWYSDADESALLAIEVNRYRKAGDKERGYEPEWSLTTIEEIGEHYPNLFRRQSEGRADEPHSWTIGFYTTKSSKGMLINTLDRALEEGEYIERSANACDELDTFELNPDGTFGAVIGGHDDEAIATMGAVWLALDYGGLDAPEYEVPRPPERWRPKRASKL